MNATIIGGASTQSRGKRPGHPVTLSHCSGAYEYTTDGRKILSWPMGQHGSLLGYPSLTNPLTVSLLDWLQDRMDVGDASLGSYAPEYEQRLADKLVTLYAPYLRSSDIGVRFFSNGTDATQAAIALSRYATHRDAFVSVGYHGGSSPVFAFKPQNGGVPYVNSELRFDFPFGGDIYPINVDDWCAGIIVEVPSVENEQLAAEWLANVADNCHAVGGMFIMDEIVTGFRYAPAGALEYYSRMNYLPGQGAGRLVEWTRNIQADFICLGKALSTYGKVAALLGPADVMSALTDKVFASFTYNDHPLGFIDALWTLGQYEKHAHHLYGWSEDSDEDFETILEIGSILKDRLNDTFAEYGFPAKCIGHPARSAVVPVDDHPRTPTTIRNFQTQLVNEYDVLLHVPNFVTLAHSLDDVDKTIVASEKVLQTWQSQ